MDDIGTGEHFAKGILAIFNLSLIVIALTLIYFRFRRAYLLLLSVLLNIVSGRYFGDLHEVMNWDNIVNYVLWKIANAVLLVWIIIGYINLRENAKRKRSLKYSKQSALRKVVLIFFISFFLLWILAIIVVLLRAILTILGCL